MPPPDQTGPDPTHGRIDRDIQAAVDDWGPKSLGQRVAIENTLQAERDSGREPLAGATGPHPEPATPAAQQPHDAPAGDGGHPGTPEAVLARFWAALCGRQQYFEEPDVVFPDPIYRIRTKPGFIFDDAFWDVFHRFGFWICHVAFYGPERSEEDPGASQGVFELRWVERAAGMTRSGAAAVPGTPDGPAVLGRALLADGAFLYLHYPSGTWRHIAWHSREEVEREHETVREVLLVRPEVGRVLEAVRELAAAARANVQLPIMGTLDRAQRLQDAERAVCAAVDALKAAELEQINREHWNQQHPDERLPEPTTGGPDHDGLTGRPPFCATCSTPIVHHGGERYSHLMDGYDDHAGPHPARAAEPAPEPTCYQCGGTDNQPQLIMGIHLCRLCRERVEARAYDAMTEPAPEPAGDGPGWSRDDIKAIISGWNLRGVLDGSQETLTNLLADRDRLERLRVRMADGQRWLAQEAAEKLRQRDRMEDERDRALGKVEQLRADHLLIPKGGIVGYRVRAGYVPGLTIPPGSVEIVLRGDLGQGGETDAESVG